jgi:hypothetical protein
MFFGSNASWSVCPADVEPHDPSQSGHYGALFGESASGQEGDWRWCHKCQGMFFAGNASKGVCPADGQPHDPSQSGHYAALIGEDAPGRQGGWRWCHKCQGMFFAGNASKGVCPADGQPHDPSQSGHYEFWFGVPESGPPPPLLIKPFGIAAAASGISSLHRLDVFVIGADRALYQKTLLLELARWLPSPTDWTRVGGSWVTSPAVTSRGLAQLDVFAISIDNNLYHWALNGSTWGSPENLGTANPAARIAPAAVSWASNRIDAFLQTGTPSPGLEHKWWDGAAWRPVSFEALAGWGPGSPCAVSWGPNRIDLIVCLGTPPPTGPQFYHKYWDGQMWQPPGPPPNEGEGPWEFVGNFTAFSEPIPAAACWAPGRIDVFAIDSQHAVNHKWHDSTGNQWMPPGDEDWEPLGRLFKRTPAVVTSGGGILDVFAVGADGALYHRNWDHNKGAWTPPNGWDSLGGTILGSPTAIAWEGRIDIFVVGLDLAVYHKKWDPNAPGTPWQSLGGTVGQLG